MMKGRGSVIFLDRTKKAKMIEAILVDHIKKPISNLNSLEIGCGNGGISSYFSKHNKHYAVDVKDMRKNTPGYEFHLVDSEALPFEDQFFDVVISHHVIEHVNDQNRHLSEIRRVLKDDGICYIATPNKSSPIMEGHVGNDQVLRYREMGPLFHQHLFACHEYGIKVVAEPDKFHGEIRFGRFFPKFIQKVLRPLYPSHMFILTKTIR